MSFTSVAASASSMSSLFLAPPFDVPPSDPMSGVSQTRGRCCQLILLSADDLRLLATVCCDVCSNC